MAVVDSERADTGAPLSTADAVEPEAARAWIFTPEPATTAAGGSGDATDRAV
jgi:hypothetical protein